VRLHGVELFGRSQSDIIDAGIGLAFQVEQIFPSFTVEQSLLGAITAHQKRAQNIQRRFPLSEMRDRALEVAEMLGLIDKLGVTASNLSHGDQKLLDIALALVLNPKVLLLDEPTAGMGPDERWRMIDRVHELWEREKITLIFIEHDMDIVFKIAPRICVLCYGKLLAEGTPAEIRDNQAVIEAYLGTSHEGAVA